MQKEAKERIRECKEYKRRIKLLDSSFKKGLLNIDDYYKALKERTSKAWSNYYDECISYYKNLSKAGIDKNQRGSYLIVPLIIILFSLGIFFFNQYTGFVVFTPQTDSPEVNNETFALQINEDTSDESLAFSTLAASNMPKKINLQGKLTDPSGNVLTGSYTFVFSIYSAYTGVGRLWTENQTISVSKGIYDTALGSVNALNLSFENPYYLGIAVQYDDEMSPRINLSTTPYTFRSNTTDYFHVIDKITSDDYLYLDDDVNISGFLNVTGQSYFGGNVGIGTGSPASPLHVASGNVEDTPQGAILMSRYWAAEANTRASSIFHYYDTPTTADMMVFGVSGGVGANVDYNTPNQFSMAKMVIRSDGNVGIGTTSPGEKLAVDGNISITATNHLILSDLAFGGGIGYAASSPNVGIKYDAPGAAAGWYGVHDFYTGYNGAASTLAMRIKNGNVGIGTTSPASELHLEDLSSGAETYMYFTNDGTGSTSSDGLKIGINSIEEPLFWNYENTDMKFATNNAVRMTIENGGNVGIGTTSPAAQLQIGDGTQQTDALFINQSAGGSSTALKINANIGGGAHPLQIGFIGSEGSLLTMDDTGSVGIGTTTPDGALHLYSTGADLTPLLKLENQATGGGNSPLILFTANDAAGASDFDVGSIRAGFITGASWTDAQMRFQTPNLTGHLVDVMTIRDSKVGIGTTSPNSTLEVDGRIKAGHTACSSSTDALDVGELNVVNFNTNDGDITIGGLANGVTGQVVYFVKETGVNNLIVEYAEPTGTQKIYTHSNLDITISGYGGLTLVCVENTWRIAGGDY